MCKVYHVFFRFDIIYPPIEPGQIVSCIYEKRSTLFISATISNEL